MILDALIFTLGVLVAGLLALAALPAVWRRALRLSGERLARLVPLSPAEIAAERDHLRAAHAVELRRTEQRLERAEAATAPLRIAAARREGRILALDAEAARAQVAVAALAAERAALRREVEGLWAESGAEAVALRGLSTLAERRLTEIAALQAERDGLRHDLDRARGSVAALETRLVGVETRNEDLNRALDRALDRALAQAPHEARAADHTHEVEGLRAELAFMAEQARSAERRAADSARAHAAMAAERGLAVPAEPADEGPRAPVPARRTRAAAESASPGPP